MQTVLVKEDQHFYVIW